MITDSWTLLVIGQWTYRPEFDAAALLPRATAQTVATNGPGRARWLLL